MNNKKIVTVVQVRRGSSRLPDKVFRPLLGKSLFVRQVERVAAAALVGQVVVATTMDAADDLVFETCAAEGIACFRGSGEDLLDRHYQAALLYNADVVIKIPGDCPLIDPAVIDRVIGYYIENSEEFDYVSNLHPASYPDGNDVEIMSMAALEKAWRDASRTFEREHTTPYIWERSSEFRIGNVVMEGGVDYSMTHRLTIDYEEDYQFIKAVFDALYPANSLFGVRDIIALMEGDAAIFGINRHLAGVNWYRNHLSELQTVEAGQTKFTLPEMKDISFRVRQHIIRLAAGGGCFIGASLSCVELMVYLYADHLRQTGDEFRDYLFLSKGHDVPALYSTFVEMGLMDVARLGNHLSTSDHIYWHPNRAVAGVEFHSGSLGHLPAVAAGVAIDCRMRGQDNRVIVITGDGELNEGSVWETILVANAHQLGNLTIVVDRNRFQANARTEDLIPLEPLADKFVAFGCSVQRIDGHDLAAIRSAFDATEAGGDKVHVIIADTVRGHGLPSIEARADRWFCAFTDAEVNGLLAELAGNGERASIESETLIVR